MRRGADVVPAAAAVEWAEARRALAELAPRLANLIRSIRHPDRPAVGEWSVGDVAVHLGQVWDLVPSLATGKTASLLKDVWELGGLTTEAVRAGRGSDLHAVADHIEAAATAFLGETAGASDDGTQAWLVEGTSLPLRAFACHLLNECVVHGHDIARAEGRPWPIDRAHARLVFLGFIVPVIQALPPRTLVDQERAAGVHACFDVRLRGGGQAYFVFDDGAVSLERSPTISVDCHLSADPVDLLLVAWARKSQWSAILRGRLFAWGRKPWLGVRLRTLMRNP